MADLDNMLNERRSIDNAKLHLLTAAELLSPRTAELPLTLAAELLLEPEAELPSAPAAELLSVPAAEFPSTPTDKFPSALEAKLSSAPAAELASMTIIPVTRAAELPPAQEAGKAPQQPLAMKTQAGDQVISRFLVTKTPSHSAAAVATADRSSSISNQHSPDAQRQVTSENPSTQPIDKRPISSSSAVSFPGDGDTLSATTTSSPSAIATSTSDTATSTSMFSNTEVEKGLQKKLLHKLMTSCMRHKEESIKKEDVRKKHEDDVIMRNYDGLGEQTAAQHYYGAGKFWAVMVLLLAVVTLFMCLLLSLLGQKDPEQKEVSRDDTCLTELAYSNTHPSTIALRVVEDDLSQIVSQNSEVEGFNLDEQDTNEFSVPGKIPDMLIDNNDSEDFIKCEKDRRDDYRVLENDDDRIKKEQHTGSTREHLIGINADSHENFDEDGLENLSEKPFLFHPVEIRPASLQLLYVKILRCNSSGDVLLAEYIRMYRHLMNFLSNFGSFAAIQTKRIEERIHDLEEYTKGLNILEYKTLTGMIHFEDMIGMIGDKSPFSGTMTYTFLQRHLQFLTLAIASIIPLDPETSLVETFNSAYRSVLARHHNWYVEKFYMVGMSQLPTKQQAMELLMVTQSEHLSMHTLMASLRLILRELNELTNASEVVLISTNALNKIPSEIDN